MLSEVERGLKSLWVEQRGRRFKRTVEAVALELRHRYPGIAAKSFGMPEQSYRMLCDACIDGEDAEFRATHRGTCEQVRTRVDAVGQPAWLAGQVQLERFGCRLDRGGVATVEPMQHRPTGEGEKDDRRVAQSAGEVQGSVVGDLGTCRVAVLEQGPTEPGEQRTVEASKPERVVGRDGFIEVVDRRSVVAAALVEVGDDPLADRQHHRSVDLGEGVGGLSVVELGQLELAVQTGELCPRVRTRCDHKRAVGQTQVMVEQILAAAATFVDVTARCGNFGIERVSQRDCAQIVAVTEDGECSAQVGIDVLRFAQLELDQPPASQRQRTCSLAHFTLAAKRVVEPAFGLDSGSRQPVRPTHPAGDRQRGLGIIIGNGPLERSPEIVLLLINRHQPGPLIVAHIGGRRARAQSGIVRGHGIADPLGVASFGELLTAVLRQRLQLRETQLIALRHGNDQRLVDESLDGVGDIRGIERLVGADSLGRRQIATAHEHRQPFEHALLVIEQQLVAPVDHRPQCLLARQRSARTTGEQAEPIVEPGGDLLDREGPGPSSGELDRQRQPIEADADV